MIIFFFGSLISLNLVESSQIDSKIDGQYYNYLVRNYEFKQLLQISPNYQTLGFLFITYPLKYFHPLIYSCLAFTVLFFLISFDKNLNPLFLTPIIQII